MYVKILDILDIEECEYLYRLLCEQDSDDQIEVIKSKINKLYRVIKKEKEKVDHTERILLNWLENNTDADQREVNDKLRQLRQHRLNKYLNAIKTGNN